jgi:hypothetical protein
MTVINDKKWWHTSASEDSTLYRDTAKDGDGHQQNKVPDHDVIMSQMVVSSWAFIPYSIEEGLQRALQGLYVWCKICFGLFVVYVISRLPIVLR